MWMFWICMNIFKILSYEETPLHLASKNGCVEIVKMLIEAGANIEAKNMWMQFLIFRSLDTPLHVASTGCLEIAKILIEAGADIHALDQ